MDICSCYCRNIVAPSSTVIWAKTRKMICIRLLRQGSPWMRLTWTPSWGESTDSPFPSTCLLYACAVRDVISRKSNSKCACTTHEHMEFDVRNTTSVTALSFTLKDIKFGGKSSLLGRSDLYLRTNYHVHLFVGPIPSDLTDKKDGLGIDPRSGPTQDEVEMDCRKLLFPRLGGNTIPYPDLCHAG